MTYKYMHIYSPHALQNVMGNFTMLWIVFFSFQTISLKFFFCGLGIDNYIPFSVGYNCSSTPLFPRQFIYDVMYKHTILFNVDIISYRGLKFGVG